MTTTSKEAEKLKETAMSDIAKMSEEEEKSRESPIPATHEEAGGAHKAKGAAKAKEGVEAATATGTTGTEAAEAPANFKTAEAYFAVLCRAKADGFAIQGPASESPIWVCNRTDKVVDVFNGLIKRNVSSVPVLLKDGKYYGFLDLMDIVRYVTNHFGAAELGAKKWEERSFFDLVDEEKKFAEKTVSDVMEYPYAPTRNTYHPVLQGYSAMTVVEALARERGLHRVPVIAPDRRIVNLVTNSQVLKFLNDNIGLLGAVSHKPLSKCSFMLKPVLSVDEDSIAIDAFNLMVSKDVVGVAICNKEGRLRGNLSLRDLKLVGADLALFWRLHQTVKNFVTKLRHEFKAKHNRPRTVVYLLNSASLGETIKTLVQHGIHRVYICDSHAHKTPIGVVSVQDILFEIINS